MATGLAAHQQMTREEFIQNNLGLVHACAGRFRGRGVEYEELYAAGCLGLVKAYEKFDVTMGYTFSTYAVPVILGEIRRIFREGGTVKVSRGIKELGLKANAVREQLLKETMTEPTIAQIAEQLDVSPEQVALAIQAAQPVVSLTSAAEEEEHQMDVPVNGYEEALAERMSLHTELAALQPEERQIILLRFYKNLTQSQTAKVMGMTQVQVSRKERKILQKMREKMLS